MPSSPDNARLLLIAELRGCGYRFVAPTPLTHSRVLARSERREARTLSDVLGWSIAFRREILDPRIFELLEAADALDPAGDGRYRSTLRVSTLHGQYYLHSAYPTDAPDAVFLGPDSYRFADLIEAELTRDPPAAGAHIVDIGTGAGVGAIVAGGLCSRAAIVMTDVNPAALRLAAINARAAAVEASALLAADLAGVDRAIDIALANPPYLMDDADRAYRDGGGMLGGEVAVDMARAACERLAPGGRLILYTGSAIVGGADGLRDALSGIASAFACTLRYREIDPDVFGEELEKPAYREVDRIALVAAIVTKP